MNIEEILNIIDEKIEYHKTKVEHIVRDGACLGHSNSYWKGRLQEDEEIRNLILQLEHFKLMPKYRHKPIEVNAFQMTKERRMNLSEWPYWLRTAWNKNRVDPWSLMASEFPYSDGTDQLMIKTPESSYLVNWDDYIIKGDNNEIYSLDPDVFEAHYELI